MAPALRSWFLLTLAVTACEFPRPPDVTDDAAGPASDAAGADAALADAAIADAPPDAPDVAGTVLHVSTTGDDANDGLTQPVKTLKHAIGLAAANPLLVKIVVATGRYSSASGETFPYTVPTNLVIVGPAGGGAIFAGTKSEPGLTVGTGTLQDVELEDFTVAITATGTARVANTRIRTSMVGIRGETTAKLTVDNLDITGAVGACSSGIVIVGAADLAATTLATRGLATTLDAKDQTTINITNANIAGDPSCSTGAFSVPVMSVTSNKSFVLVDSLIDRGNNGLSLGSGLEPLHVNLTSTIIRNMNTNALTGTVGVVFVMTGGALSSNGRGGAELGEGNWSFTNVTVDHNAVFGIYLQDATLRMRDCTVTSNGDGVYLLTPISVDLGTAADPGNNILKDNSDVSLNYDSSRIQVEAVGNIWKPGIQGADGSGRYGSPAVLQGPIALAAFNNYAMACAPGQCTLHR